MRDYDAIKEALTFYAATAETTRKTRALLDAADAIEELAKQIAEAGKMLDELISYAQNNADESREAEKRYYGDDFTVSRYTWMHNQKCTHERYVEKLERIAMMLPMPPKEVRDA